MEDTYQSISTCPWMDTAEDVNGVVANGWFRQIANQNTGFLKRKQYYLMADAAANQDMQFRFNLGTVLTPFEMFRKESTYTEGFPHIRNITVNLTLNAISILQPAAVVGGLGANDNVSSQEAAANRRYFASLYQAPQLHLRWLTTENPNDIPDVVPIPYFAIRHNSTAVTATAVAVPAATWTQTISFTLDVVPMYLIFWVHNVANFGNNLQAIDTVSMTIGGKAALVSTYTPFMLYEATLENLPINDCTVNFT